MIELIFVRKSAVMHVFVKEGIVSLLLSGFKQPIQLNEQQYKKLSESQEIKKALETNYEDLEKQYGEKGADIIIDFMEELSKNKERDFHDEATLKPELVKDFQETGWRCIKR